MRFVQQATVKREVTITVAIEEVDVRFTRSGKRVGRIYALGDMEDVIIQYWGDAAYTDDEKFQSLIDLAPGSLVTMTGKMYDDKETKRKKFDVEIWEDHQNDGEPPANITEVPF